MRRSPTAQAAVICARASAFSYDVLPSDVATALRQQAASIRGQPVIWAELTGDDLCEGSGSSAPVLALCRQLLAAGLDPDQAVQVCRAGTLALTVRSIGETARLELNGKGSGFKAVGIAVPARNSGKALANEPADCSAMLEAAE